MSCILRKRGCRKATWESWNTFKHITRDIFRFFLDRRAHFSCNSEYPHKSVGIGDESVRYPMSATDPRVSPRFFVVRFVFFRWKTLWRRSCPSPESLVVKPRLRLQVFDAFPLYVRHANDAAYNYPRARLVYVVSNGLRLCDQRTCPRRQIQLRACQTLRFNRLSTCVETHWLRLHRNWLR